MTARKRRVRIASAYSSRPRSGSSEPAAGASSAAARTGSSVGENDDFGRGPGQGLAARARQVLEELRRRLGDPSRPQVEQDYLERLLKRY